MVANAVIAHGGGPTAVINASLAGLIEEFPRHSTFGRLYGARYGVRGLLGEEFFDLSAQDPAVVHAVGETPGSAIGSSRQKLETADHDRILDIFRRREVRYFFYTGGNGSMGTALAFERYARERNYKLSVIGIPKTIDNDLAVTDHTPGWASTARFFACAARDVGEDNRSLPSPVCVLEVLGRNAGWVVAATSFARRTEDDAPHLIYFPELPVTLDQICGDVERVFAKRGRAVVAICEGQLDPDGRPFGADVDRPDVPQHRLASNLGHSLARLITERTGIRARSEKPGLLGRSCGPFASVVDREEAWECGRAAARAAAGGESGVMVGIRRDSDAPYRSSTFLVPLADVALTERVMPVEWIASDANDVLPAFTDYAAPLVGPIESYARLRF